MAGYQELHDSGATVKEGSKVRTVPRGESTASLFMQPSHVVVVDR